MRWDHLTKERDDGARLPGMGGAPVVRTFDAPEALGINFHEVHARSAINDVPPMAHVDFRHTINPYRGCSHGCAYCVDGDTLVLLGNGNNRRIADLRIGDEIYGTRLEGGLRRYVKTEVLAHWRTEKPAYRVVLENGSELVASGDHRFLTDRGWKYVTGTEQGARRQPHLTTNSRLSGFGTSLPVAAHGESYARGYVCGMLRGDATIGTWKHGEGGRRRVNMMRLALTDREALERTRGFLTAAGVKTRTFELSPGNHRHRAVHAIAVSSIDGVERCRALIEWPRLQNRAWTKGFLAGLFDAEGSCSKSSLRIHNTDEKLIARAKDGLLSLGLPTRLEPPRLLPSGKVLWILRLRGGLGARTTFLQATDPAVRRKRDFSGTAVKAMNRLGVQAVEPLGKTIEMFDITTGTEDFIANGVISHNCFARPTHEYLGFDAREDFRRQIVVKVNLPEVLRAELRRPSWKGEHIALGTNTDPYQWVESRYEITRGIWQELLEARNPCSILTRSPLMLRDLDLFRRLSEVTDFAANLSIPTIDEKAWRATEPASPNPMKRIEAIKELSDAGIKTGVLVAPLMPGINDSPEQVERILQLCGEAGADSIGGIGLHLRGPLKSIFMDWLRQYRPELVERYDKLYGRGAHLPQSERGRMQRMIKRGRMQTPGAPPARRRKAPGQTAPGRRLTGGDEAPAASRTRQAIPADAGTPQKLF